MILLRRVERAGREYLRGDIAMKTVDDLLARGARGSPLLGAADKDRGVIVGARVTRLPVRLERVDVVPKGPEQRLVPDLGGIVDDLHRLEVAGVALHDRDVGGVLRPAAHEAGRRRDHAGQIIVGVLHRPETAAGECGGVEGGGYRDQGKW